MESLFSPFWYRVTDLVPHLRQHIEISSHKVRDKTWYIYQDTISGRTHQFSPIAHFFISLMNGKRTVQQLWDALNNQFGDESPNQTSIIQLLAQLHSADIIKTDVTPQVDELFRRTNERDKKKLKSKFTNPFSLRFSLIDPDEFLDRVQPWFGWVFSRLFLLLCILFLVYSGAVLIGSWDELVFYGEKNAFSQSNLFFLLITYPIIKLFHEFGHAIATKHWGGEVHEMGIMFIFFTPVPYVDASSSTAFRNKTKRIFVSSAGIIIELLLAALGLYVWVHVEPGVVKTIAFNVMLIGGVSTLIFNGNPLLRYDAYYVLSDFLEIPNLAYRSNKFVGYIVLRFIFGAKDYPSQVKARGEAFWFVVYSSCSFLYRMFILFFIVLLISNQYYFIGIILGVWIVLLQIIVPLSRNVLFILSDSRMKLKQVRVWSTSIILLGLFYQIFFNTPVPYSTVSEGIVSLDATSQIRTQIDGFVDSLNFEYGGNVSHGEEVIKLKDPLLESNINSLNSRLSQLEIEYRSGWNSDRIKQKVIREEIENIKNNIVDYNEISHSLSLRSPADGKLIIPGAKDLKGRFMAKGTLLGYVMNKEHLKARVMVTQDDMNLIKETDVVLLRFAGEISKEFNVRMIRRIPSATNILPNAALGTSGGGAIRVDLKDNSGTKALDKYFEIWTTLPESENRIYLGSRVYVKFIHKEEPLFKRLERWMNQLLLSQVNA